jgi:hypothetical integral membrane protein (TIGR02206 family)
VPPLPDTFRPFSLLHVVALLTSLGAMAALVAAGLRLRPGEGEARLTRAWAWSMILFQIAASAWWLLPSNYSPERSIPLNLCRLAAFIAPLALLTPPLPWRWPRALLYFWGLGLCTQALITPVFPEGPAHTVFWIFWIGHTQIVGSALYDLIVRRYRPTARDLATAVLVAVLYTAVAFLVNLVWGRNYGGLGRTLFDAPNLARRLGPWPWRVLWISLIAAAWMALLHVIWLRRPTFQAPAPPRPSTPPRSMAPPPSP